ncbi:GIY-YIG nuclease family protein [Rhodobacteraceae bacterium XHP0102]|nr:GIY-YIG nuclease family protein [Rhodobacteraceae bacterium XHP0102]
MPKKMWTKELVRKEAKKYSTPVEFKRGSAGAYRRACRDGYIQEVCSHMTSSRWNREKLLKVAAQYTSLKEFRNSEKGAYLFALKKGLKNEATAHMTRLAAAKNYWDYERCAAEAQKYSNRTEFMRKSGSAYNRALSENWIDEICQHMGTPADGYHHCVYVILNRRLNKAYIGITRQHLAARIKHHKGAGNTTKSKHISTLNDTEFHALTDYEFDVKEVKNVEAHWCSVYQDLGFEVLNDIKQLGRVGTSQRIYTDDDILAEARKYSRRVDFKLGSPKLYDAAVSQRLLEKACEHMRGINKKGHWTKEACIEFAKSCSDREEFCKSTTGAYDASVKNNWLDEVYNVLRSRRDMGWLKAKGDRIQLWKDAGSYHQIWLKNNCCGYWKMRTLTGHNLQKMVRKFEAGWIPSEDQDWRRWREMLDGKETRRG